ncbi:MAG: alanyl-tRNA editing protein [Pseudomonadota bacterium]
MVAHTPEGGIVVDQTVFYATGGGQPGDSGQITWDGGMLDIATAVKNGAWDIALVPAEPAVLPPVGTTIEQQINAARRLRHMRVHTALHLLSVVIPLPVTGGSIGPEKGRLDFDMDAPPDDKDALQHSLDTLIAHNLPVREEWISDADLAANPGLVKTLSVAPPAGEGQVRLIRIGLGEDTVDLQPCGGTHVASTGDIGAVRLGKIEKKGRQNRRVYLHLTD